MNNTVLAYHHLVIQNSVGVQACIAADLSLMPYIYTGTYNRSIANYDARFENSIGAYADAATQDSRLMNNSTFMDPNTSNGSIIKELSRLGEAQVRVITQ
jgi:hypothetical protein